MGHLSLFYRNYNRVILVVLVINSSHSIDLWYFSSNGRTIRTHSICSYSYLKYYFIRIIPVDFILSLLVKILVLKSFYVLQHVLLNTKFFPCIQSCNFSRLLFNRLIKKFFFPRSAQTNFHMHTAYLSLILKFSIHSKRQISISLRMNS